MWLDAADLMQMVMQGITHNRIQIFPLERQIRKCSKCNFFQGQNPITFVPNSINGQSGYAVLKSQLNCWFCTSSCLCRFRAGYKSRSYHVYRLQKGANPGTNGAGQALWGNDNGAWDRFFL